MKYIEGSDKQKECFICKKVLTKDTAKEFLLFKTSLTIAFLNTYPYTQGHILVSPCRHIATPSQLTDEELLDKEKVINIMLEALIKTFNPHGFNIGVNLGQVAGAGLKSHYHIHIVPRWTGDANFMTTISETRVINQDLKETYRKIKANLPDGNYD